MYSQTREKLAQKYTRVSTKRLQSETVPSSKRPLFQHSEPISDAASVMDTFEMGNMSQSLKDVSTASLVETTEMTPVTSKDLIFKAQCEIKNLAAVKTSSVLRGRKNVLTDFSIETVNKELETVAPTFTKFIKGYIENPQHKLNKIVLTKIVCKMDVRSSSESSESETESPRNPSSLTPKDIPTSVPLLENTSALLSRRYSPIEIPDIEPFEIQMQMLDRRMSDIEMSDIEISYEPTMSYTSSLHASYSSTLESSSVIVDPVSVIIDGDIKGPEFKEACSQIKKDIQRLEGAVNVCPSLNRNGQLVFLIYTKTKDIVLPETYSRLKVEFKYVNFKSSENDRVVSSAEYLNTDLTSADASEMNKVLLNNYDNMFENHSNLVSITASSIKSRKFDQNNKELIKKPCFVLFVPAKGYIPLNENKFPEKIGEYPTDVREGTFKLYGHHAQDYHPTLRMGCAISGENKAQGTLGVFVKLKGKTYFITSAHVLLFGHTYASLKKNGTIANLSCIQNDKVHQPDINTGISPIGRISKAIYRTGDIGHAGIEAALIEETDEGRLPKAGIFPEGDFSDMGFSTTSPMTFTSGEVVNRTESKISRTEVLKYGSETGITRGLFKLSGPCVHRALFNDGKEVVLLNQLQILGTGEGPFAKPGDSGALVLVPHKGSDDDLRALGIVTGGIGEAVCCVTPIWDILQAFESEFCLKLELKTF